MAKEQGLILGINAYHADSAACIIRDGTLLAAAEEERFRREKHWAGLPTQAIEYCLSAAGAQADELTAIAVNTDPSAHRGAKLRYVATHPSAVRLALQRLRNSDQRWSIKDQLAHHFQCDLSHVEFCPIEHHRAHLASAFFASPYDEAAVVSVDGFGDFSSAAWGIGFGNDIQIQGRVHFPHSLGIFYQAITQYLGFWSYGDEYKVMGLAPYGEPNYTESLRKLVYPTTDRDGSFALDLRYFRHQTGKVPYVWENQTPTIGQLYTEALEELLGPARRNDETLTQKHKDIARSAQAIYEERFFGLLNALAETSPSRNLCISGGCGMNSVANGKVHQQTPYRNVYVQAAAGDAGGAIGAAMTRSLQSTPDRTGLRMKHCYLGPSYSDVAIKQTLKEHGVFEGTEFDVQRIDDQSKLCRSVARAIADGQVVGWFQGAMEWGPRALGNRSILGDPRRHDMKDILNQKIKRRESFRPFAPSVLREQVTDWFESDADVPFMQKVFTIQANRRDDLPAVTHVDGSGRLQTVTDEGNPRYSLLIREFYKETGVPMVLNTSFNENEPVVCHPSEALACFLRTNMDVLVLGDWCITRTP